MKLLEYEAKNIFRSYGISVPPSGGVIKTAPQLAGALKKAGKGPWALKAQVLRRQGQSRRDKDSKHTSRGKDRRKSHARHEAGHAPDSRTGACRA